jgi:cytochrome c553
MNRWLALLASVGLIACGSGNGPGSAATGDPAVDDAGAPDLGNPATPDAGGSHDGGGTTGGDAGAPHGDASAPPPSGDAGLNAFTGAPAYVATLGTSARNAKHTNGGNPAGTACLTCHDGQRGVTEFLFGGTVWMDATATTPAAHVEVRVLGANGTGQSAYSDTDGNFFFARAANPALSAPARAGLRDSASTHLMSNLISEGNCNECHRAGGQGLMHMQ